jgi:hypothetical protein
MRDPSHPPFTSHKMPFMYSTPLRSLISKDLTNLFFAGRLASFSHVVYGSQRVMKTCATMGQAVGTAAAYATNHGVDPITLKDHPEAIWSIQQQLVRDDAFIIGLYNADPRDHARNATVTASSEQANGTAANVISGQTRAVVTADDASIGSGGGVPPSQAKNGTNRWISEGLPASVTLALAGPVPVKQVQLIFDTGMHRKLAFSVVFPTNNPDSFWGPQAETVRDYYLEGEVDGQWVMLCNVTDNYQRRRVHTLPCPAVGPSPAPPPPVKPSVAPGSVAATLCNVTSPAQRWVFQGDPDHGGVTLSTRSGALCLGFNESISAYGGHGNSVIASPCGPLSTRWNYTAAPGGSFLRTAIPHKSCTGSSAGQSCECVHPVACTACHGTDIYTPPTSVELWECIEGTHMKWSSLQVNDGHQDAGGVLLMTDGLCLQAPTADDGRSVGSVSPAPPQRVQAKTAEDIAALRAPAPLVSKVRVTVTATNGISHARINEIRIYDASGVAPFPQQ